MQKVKCGLPSTSKIQLVAFFILTIFCSLPASAQFTSPPTLLAPTSGAETKSLHISYILPQTPLANSIKLTLTDGTNTYEISMSTNTSVDFIWNPLQSIFTASSDVLSAPPALSRNGVSGALPDQTYTVTISYQNSFGDPAEGVSATGVVVDATGPVITRLGSSSVDVTQGTTYTDAGATASDARNGNVTSSIVTTNPVDTNVIGTYTVRYNVDDALGNHATEVTRSVNVVAPTPTPTSTPTSTPTATPTPTPTPISGPVTGSITPATGNILMYVYRYDIENSQSGYAEGSCLTQTDGTFSCPVSAVGEYLVQPKHNEYLFSPLEAVLPSGLVTSPFSATSQPISIVGCKKKDFSKTIQNADTRVRALYTYLLSSLAKAQALAEKTSNTSQRLKLLAAIQSISSKPLPKFSSAIGSTKDIAPVVLTCKSAPNCQKRSLRTQVNSFNRNANAIAKLLTSLSEKVSSVKNGSGLASKIATKQKTLLQSALEASGKLPTVTYSCN